MKWSIKKASKLGGGSSYGSLHARVSTLLVILGKVDRDAPEERKTQAVEPDDQVFALVAVVVPIPWRGEDDVPALHGDLLAFDSRESILSLDDEPQRERGVSVRGGCLARQDELEAAVDCIGGVGGFCCGMVVSAIERYTCAHTEREEV